MKYTKEKLEENIKNSTSWREVCDKLGCKANTGSQTHLMNRAKVFGLTWTHFPGQGHGKGKIALNRKNALDYCVKGVPVSSHKLKLALIRDGLKKAECERCGYTHWEGEPIVLELDHIDNDHLNNEFDNLKILCPNCHALKTRNAGVAKLANTH